MDNLEDFNRHEVCLQEEFVLLSIPCITMDVPFRFSDKDFSCMLSAEHSQWNTGSVAFASRSMQWSCLSSEKNHRGKDCCSAVTL